MRSPRRRALHRPVLLRAAGALGAIALVLGTAACTGDEDPSAEGSPSTQDQEPGANPGDGEEPAASDGGGERGTSPFSDEELDDASVRFVEALQALDDEDWETACELVVDPSTGTAPEGDRLQECVDGVEPALAEHADLLVPGMFDVIEPEMVTAEDNDDDTVSITVIDQEIDIPMTQGEDGLWYLSVPF
ncbi:hypothetical protein ACT3SP_02690 [Brachybacterium sp. AOP43-C2-M15]|uniref:hypothetical protein n=1 Tax=Brachybacterium sp. AOP43-C2-M15 TaxID=3457661 RepID=UPI004034BFC5